MKKYLFYLVFAAFFSGFFIVNSNTAAAAEGNTLAARQAVVWQRLQRTNERIILRICAQLDRHGLSSTLCEQDTTTPDPNPDPDPEPDPICGDNVVNQETEECDGSAGVQAGLHCTNQCTLEADIVSPDTAPVVINEIYYDVVSPEYGSEGNNEWVELYNTTDESIDITGWVLGDQLLPTTTIESHGFAVVTPGTGATSTQDFWTLPQGMSFIVVEGRITSSGLSNTGDTIILEDSSQQIMDAVSYGNKTDAFDPSISDVSEGHSVERIVAGFDTNQASDWKDQETPTPGL